METAGFNEPPQRLAMGGVYNHMLMFGLLGPATDNAENRPLGPLSDSIAQYYSDFEGFKEAFRKAAMSRVLPGWIWLGVCKADGRLLITQTNNEDNPLMHGVVDVQCTPILGLDLWEHAFLQQYGGNKEAYVDEFFKCVQWGIVSANFELFNSQGNPTPVAE